MKTLNKLIIIMLLSPLTMIGQMDDKTMHMIAGNVISTGVGYTMYEITDKPALSVGIGFFSGVLAGVLKEAYDKQQGRVFNNQDLTATIWGSLIGSLNKLKQTIMEKTKVSNYIKTSIVLRQYNLKLSRMKGQDSKLLVYQHMGVLPMRRSLVVIWLN